jgi:molecular chaperone GrpE
MVKVNGRTEAERARLDLEHELPAGDDGDETAEVAAVGEGQPLEAAETSGVEAEMQKLRAERDSLLDRLARSQAEFENARRRAGREQQEFRDYATVDAIKSLLPVLDSFERALQVKAEPGDFRSGVELIYKQLQDALSKLGVRRIPAKGEQFDPRHHEAIDLVETADAPDHEVLEELQHGYKLKERLLRPAMVKVAKNPGK